MADIFVSYSQKDRDIAEKLAAVLEAQGFAVWWDYNLIGGTKFRQEINKELASARAVVVLWSAHSVVSDWVLDEAEEAKAQGKLVPVRLPSLDYRSIPLGFRSLQVELADQPERIMAALLALGLSSKQQAPERILNDYWNLIARKVKPPGLLSRRSVMTAIAGGALGVASTMGYQVLQVKRYLTRERAIHNGRVTGVLALPDGKSTITVGEDGAVVVSSILTGEIETRLAPSGSAITSVALSDAYKTAYCTHRDGTVSAWNYSRKAPPTVSDLQRGTALRIQLAAGYTGRFAVILLENGDVLRCGYDERGVNVQNSYKIGAKAICAFSAPFLIGHCLVAYAKNATADVIALDNEEGRSLAGIDQDLTAHDGPITQIQTLVRSVAGSRGSERHVYSFTASEDATIRCGDHYSRRMLYSLAGHRGSVETLAILDRNGRPVLASSGLDRTVKLWDGTERRMVKDFGQQSAQTTALAFAAEGTALLAGTADGRLQHWETSELLGQPSK